MRPPRVAIAFLVLIGAGIAFGADKFHRMNSVYTRFFKDP